MQTKAQSHVNKPKSTKKQELIENIIQEFSSNLITKLYIMYIFFIFLQIQTYFLQFIYFLTFNQQNIIFV